MLFTHERAGNRFVAWMVSTCQLKGRSRVTRPERQLHYRVARSRQRGQVIPILAISSTVLISLAALALDLGLAQDARTSSQVATDAASEEAAYQLAHGGQWGPGSTTEQDALGIAYLNGILAAPGNGVHNNQCTVPGSIPGTGTDYYYDIPFVGSQPPTPSCPMPASKGWKYSLAISIPPATPMAGCNVVAPFNCVQVQAQSKAVPILGGIVGFGATTPNTSAVAQDNAGSFTNASGQPANAVQSGGNWGQQQALANSTLLANQVGSPNPAGALAFSEVPSPNASADSHLLAVSCVASNWCMAGGYYNCRSGACAGNDQTLFEHWDGSNWAITPSGNDSASDPNYVSSVSCAANGGGNECWGVGYYKSGGVEFPIVEEWNPVTQSWTELSQPLNVNTALSGVSCPDPTFCLAVGVNQSSSTAFAEQWSLGSWAVSPAPVAGTSSGLDSVSCTSSSFCMATGYQVAAAAAPRQTLTEEFGSTNIGTCGPLPLPSCTWTVIPSYNGSAKSNELIGISCNATFSPPVHYNFFCLASGLYNDGTSNQALAEYWPAPGGGWGAASPSSSPGSLDSVSCVSATWCVATFADTPALLWNGITATPQWTHVDSNQARLNPLFNGVSCTAVSACIAVGYSDSGDNSTLTEQLGAKPAAPTLTGVSCFSSTFCMAVGDYGVGGLYQTLIEEWGPYGCSPSTTPCSWQLMGSPNAGVSDNNYLYGVSCFSTNLCMAVGYYVDPVTGTRPLAMQWDGNSWGTAVIPPTLSAGGSDELRSVSCSLSSLCIAVGFEGSTVPVSALAEQWGVPGSPCPCNWVPLAPGSSVGHDSYLDSVACNGNAMCMAVGYFKAASGNYQPLADLWNGGWNPSAAAPPAQTAFDNQLNSVDCPSPTLCMAAGSYSDGANSHNLAESWNGTSWAAPPLLPPAPAGSSAEQLTGISCDSATDCWASGQASIGGAVQTLIENWNGSSISILSSPNPPGGKNQLQAISCWLLDSCFAVGSMTTTTLPATLAIEVAPLLETNVLNSVSCNDQNHCNAVGYYQNPAGTWQNLAESWNGTQWGLMSPPNYGSFGNDLTGVNCPSTDWCMAVGWYATGANNAGKQTLFEIWTSGGGWGAATAGPPLPADSAFNSVSCTGTSACWAVGYTTSGGVEQTLVAFYNGGWTVAGSGNGNTSYNNLLTSVSCPSSGFCAAVGYYGVSAAVNQVLVEQYNGSSWALASSSSSQFDTAPLPTPLDNRLNGVSCNAADSCVAVGSAVYPTNPSHNQTLIEQYNGSAWAIKSNDTSNIYDISTTDNEQLLGVACSGDHNCLAVGSAGGNTLALAYSSSGWSLTPAVNPASSNALLSASCWNDNNGCVIVGYYAYGASPNQPLVETYSSGDQEGQHEGQDNQGPRVRFNTLVSVTGTGANNSSPSTSTITVGNFLNGSNADRGYSQILKTGWNSGTWDSTVVICPANVCSQTESYYIKGISCVGTSFCVAVGYHCNGEEEDCNPENQSNGHSGVPLAVECTNTCNQSNAHWCISTDVLCQATPGSWWLMNSAPPGPSGTSYLNSVSCVSAGFCVAAGQYYCDSGACNGHYQTLIDQFDGVNWTTVPSQDKGGPTIDNYLYGVSCGSASLCKAVGHASGATYDEALILDMNNNSGRWGVENAFNQTAKDNYLASVSCAGPALCMATGYYCSSKSCGSGNQQTLAESCVSCAGGAAVWSNTSPADASTSDQLLSVDCIGISSCLAVGYYNTGGSGSDGEHHGHDEGHGGQDNALVESWGPSGWLVANADKLCKSGHNAHLFGVSESSNSGSGIAVGDCDNGGGGEDDDGIYQNFAEVGGSNSAGTGVTLVG